MTVRRDITGIVPLLVKRTIRHIREDWGLSRTQLRKLGLIPNPWKGHGRWKKG